MADETRIITQPAGDEFLVGLNGQRPDSDGCIRPIVHQARLLHEGGVADRPFVHMVCWDREAACRVDFGGEVRHVGDPERPIPLDMRHSTPEPVRLDLDVASMEHGLAVKTGLQDPIHHAVQLKTPLQVRFVNPWEAESSYTLTIHLGKRELMTLNLQGKTTLTPKPAPADPCTPQGLVASPRVRTMPDLSGRLTTR